jgi:hypothetical protein
VWIKTASLIVLLILSSLLIEDVVTPHCVSDDNTVYQSSVLSHQDGHHHSGNTPDTDHRVTHFGHCSFVLSSHMVLILPTVHLLNPTAHYSFTLKLNKPAPIIRPPIT